MYEGTTRQKRPRDFLNYSLFWRVLDVVEVFVVLDFLAPPSPAYAPVAKPPGTGATEYIRQWMWPSILWQYKRMGDAALKRCLSFSCLFGALACYLSFLVYPLSLTRQARPISGKSTQQSRWQSCGVAATSHLPRSTARQGAFRGFTVFRERLKRARLCFFIFF